MVSPRFRSIAFGLAISQCTVWLFGCKVFAHDFEPAKDELALARIFVRFEARQPPLSLTVCEDTARVAVGVTDGCDVVHLARAGGLSRVDHLEHFGGGCTACPLENVALIKGRLVGSGLAQPLELVGKAVLGNGYRDDPYAPPYRITLESADGEVSLELEVRASGKHVLRLFKGPLAEGQVPRNFRAAEPATCPLPEQATGSQ